MKTRGASAPAAASPSCALEIAVIAETLALALVVASPGSPPARAALALQPDNTVRARRGLLPRKMVRMQSPARRRIVLLPQAPTWLGEPDDPAELAPEPAVDVAAGAVAARVTPVPAADGGVVRVSLEDVAVEARLVQPSAGADVAALRATVAAPQLEVLVRRVTRG